MFWTLFFKECKQILKSTTFYIFLACIIIFYVSEMGQLSGINKPVPGQINYGMKSTSDETSIMNSTLDILTMELQEKDFSTYPIGFIKHVKLNDKKAEKIYLVLEHLTGENKEQIIKTINNFDLASSSLNINKQDLNTPSNSIKVKKGTTYKEFLADMNKIDDIIGGGSSYSSIEVAKHGEEPKTYEDALKDYESIINNDKVSRAYARYFADFMVIVASLLPVFLAVTRCLQDKRSQAEQVIYCKRCSSSKIILSRYAAFVVIILAAFIVISISPLLQSIYIADSNNITPDYLAFIKVIFQWLMPSVLVSLSVGFFLTETTNGLLAILVQGLWWFISVFKGTANLVGPVHLNLAPRFNAIGEYNTFKTIYQGLVTNRLFYTAFAVVLLILTIIVHDLKRKGKLNLSMKKSSNK